ncbi:MAG: TonB-dependent receptor [Erythrobacter sp.]
MIIDKTLRATVSLAALAGAAAGTPAFANEVIEEAIVDIRADVDDADAQPARVDEGLRDIVVTAERRETRLQKTPISISVVDNQDLLDRNIRSLADLADGSVPSLRIAPFFNRTSALSVGIRGIVPFDANQPSRDAAVGVYVDGVFLGRSQGLGAALLDIERIEVLKGPQGTLFGRNAVGGAISIVTKKPTGEFGMRTTVGLRNFGGYLAETHIDLPEWNGLSFKIDAISTLREGTVRNPLQGEEDFNRFDRRGLRASVLWRPSSNFEAVYAFDAAYDATTPFYFQITESTPGFPLPLAPIQPVRPNRLRDADVGVPQQNSVGRTQGHLLTMEWTASDSVTVKSISSYREVEQDQWDNGLGLSLVPFIPNRPTVRYSLANLDQFQISQELQLLGTLPRFNYVLGGYFYYEKGSDDAWSPNTMQWNATGTALTRLPTLASGAVTPFPDRASTAIAESYAAFAQGTWNPAILDDMISITAGARLTHDRRSGDLTKVNGQDILIPFAASYTRVDPMVTVALDPTDDLHFYAKFGTAYRAGGANSRSIIYRPFDPESVETFEAGFKADFWDRKARLNVAAFTTRYVDIQIDFNAQLEEGTTRTTIETVNADGNGRIRGVEVDLNLAPVKGLMLSGSYAYTKGELPQALNPFNGQLEQSFIVFTPENAFSFAGTYTHDFGAAVFRANFSANLSDGYRGIFNSPTLSDRSVLVNGRVSLGEIKLGRGAEVEFAAWTRNLFDREQRQFALDVAALGRQIAFFNEPRQLGLDMQVRF